MNPTPTTRHRHALRWVLGVGLVFVVIVALAVVEARRVMDADYDSAVMVVRRELNASLPKLDVIYDSERSEARDAFGWRYRRSYRFDAFVRGGQGEVELVSFTIEQRRKWLGSELTVTVSTLPGDQDQSPLARVLGMALQERGIVATVEIEIMGGAKRLVR